MDAVDVLPKHFKKSNEVFSLSVEKTRFFQRVQEFLSLSLNSRTAITNMPKLSIRDRTSKVSIHPSPPNTHPSQTSVCPIHKIKWIKIYK
jgi:hypothetical protein